MWTMCRTSLRYRSVSSVATSPTRVNNDAPSYIAFGALARRAPLRAPRLAEAGARQSLLVKKMALRRPRMGWIERPPRRVFLNTSSIVAARSASRWTPKDAPSSGKQPEVSPTSVEPPDSE